MNLWTIRMEFMEENGDEVQIVADEIVDGIYYILARDGDKPIFAYGSALGDDDSDGGDAWACQFYALCEVGAPYQPWFESALRAEGLKSEFDSELLRDRLAPSVP